MSYITSPAEVFWPEFWMGTLTLIYVSEVSRISASLFLHPTN